jgi:hypothetical protein
MIGFGIGLVITGVGGHHRLSSHTQIRGKPNLQRSRMTAQLWLSMMPILLVVIGTEICQSLVLKWKVG